MKVVTNWTSTTVPLWETDCIQFWRAGQPFQLRDVSTEEHFLFIAQFSNAHNIAVRRDGTVVTFEPRLND